MLLKFKTYKKTTPPKTGEKPSKIEVPFDEKAERESVLLMLGIDPNLTDGELAEYKTAFSATFADILDDKAKAEEADGNDPKVKEYPVLEYVDLEIKAKKTAIDLINKEYALDYTEAVEKWEKGSDIFTTIEVPNDVEKAKEVEAAVEKQENFLEWVDEYTINEIDDRYTGKAVNMELRAFKVGDKYVILPQDEVTLALTVTDEDQLRLIASEHELELTEIPVDDLPDSSDDVLTIYQFYAYVDTKFGPAKVFGDSLVDALIDEARTIEENKELLDYDDVFASGTKVTNFNEDDVFNKLQDL